MIKIDEQRDSFYVDVIADWLQSPAVIMQSWCVQARRSVINIINMITFSSSNKTIMRLPWSSHENLWESCASIHIFMYFPFLNSQTACLCIDKESCFKIYKHTRMSDASTWACILYFFFTTFFKTSFHNMKQDEEVSDGMFGFDGRVKGLMWSGIKKSVLIKGFPSKAKEGRGKNPSNYRRASLKKITIFIQLKSLHLYLCAKHAYREFTQTTFVQW